MGAEGYLGRILEPGGLRTAFQPIMRWRESGWTLQGFEGLVRGPRGTNLEDAEVLFEYVRRKHAEPVVDRRCIEEILKAAVSFGPPVYLTANVHAATLEQDRGFPGFVERTLDQYWVNPSRFTIEVVEHSPSRCGDRFLEGLDALRNLGCTIALDDVGLGYANYRMMLEVRPDCFKIDRYVVHGAHSDYYRRAVVRSIVDLAGSFGAYAVAEGIDSIADLEAVLGEGVNSCQGFLFGRPTSAPLFGKWDLACSAAERLPQVAEAHEWAEHRDWLLRSSALLTGSSTS
jgi:EAL domain-containing protein (putative c-di-GMP-specific phosphodiesterase class I)